VPRARARTATPAADGHSASNPGRRGLTGALIRWCAGVLLAASISGCSSEGSEIQAVVDLRGPGSGTIPIILKLAGVRRGERVNLAAFLQPEALRITTVTASQGSDELRVERSRDARGFEQFVITPGGEHDVEVRYSVRPGPVEEVRMAGPTGYRFGHLDPQYALVSGRQLLLLPTDPAPRHIDVEFRLPAGWRLDVPWRARRTTNRFAYRIAGREASARALDAVLAAGELDTRNVGSFRVTVARALPESLRARAVHRAETLENQLSEIFGARRRPFGLILVPTERNGMLISVPPGADGIAQSLGEGVPTRWLSIARAMAASRVAERSGDRSVPARLRWAVEGLPLLVATSLSERNGWRPRQAWMEQFYYEAAGLEIDLETPGDLGDAPDPLLREWRAALALDRVDQTLRETGQAGIEDRLRDARGGFDPVSLVERDLSTSARKDVRNWTAPKAYALPFPGPAMPPRRVALPPSTMPAGSRDLDLYLGGRNLGLLEQCGCRGEQAGGLARRATILASRARGKATAVAFELGDAVPFDQKTMPLDPQKEAESDLVFEVMAASGQQASVISHAELSYGPRFLENRLARLPKGFHLLSANVRAAGVTPALEDERSGLRVRVTGAEDPSAYHLGRSLEFEDATAAIPIGSVPESVSETLGAPDFGSISIVAGSLSPTTVLALQRLRPDLSLIVTDDYFRFAQDPRFAFERPLGDSLATLGLLGRTLLVVLRTDTFALGHVNFAVDPAGQVTAAGVEALVLDEHVPDHAPTRRRLDQHYAAMAAAEGLAVAPPVGMLREQLGGAYVGSAACRSCHEPETRQWKTTAHASAFVTMLDRRRQGVPRCVRCHVTGYRHPGGYQAITQLALRHVQCESCHGPGSRHVNAPASDNIVRDPSSAVCMECHDPEHSEMTAANFREYRSRIVHVRN